MLTPQIGTGTGTNFRKNEINGVQVADGANSTILRTNIVTNHPSAPNALLLSDEFEAKWSSDCPSFNFSIRNQSISAGSVATRYDTTCMGDNEVTLDVYPTGNPDQVLVTQRTTITFSSSTMTPALGNGVGAGFQVGQIAATSVSLAENQSTSLTVTAVDANNGNQSLTDNYRFVFSSDCLSSGDAGLSITSVVASGAVNTTYTNKSCSGDDLVTARLFKEGVDETDPANAISTATVVLSTIKPSLLLNSADDIAVVRSGSVNVSLSVVDVVRDNAVLVNPYRFTFESACAGASFAHNQRLTETGTVTNTYSSGSCSVEDTITVKVYNPSDDVSTATPRAEINFPVRILTPLIGTGVGAEFALNQLGGNLKLEGVRSTVLNATVVTDQPSAPNALLVSAAFDGVWTSSCSDATFSVSRQNLAQGTLQTQLNIADDGCAGNNDVTLTIYPAGKSAPVLVALTKTYSVTDGPVKPTLGNGVGAAFVNGRIESDDFAILAGARTFLTVTAVDSNGSNALLNGDYQYTFASGCSADNRAKFSIPSTLASSGTVTTAYDNIRCEGSDTVTARLFAAGADVTSATPLAAATVILNTALPKLGFGEGADFADELIQGASIVEGQESIELAVNAVNPMTNNSMLSEFNYTVQWTSDCDEGRFTVNNQSLQEGIVKTRYTSGVANCLGDNTITATLVERNDPTTSLAEAEKVVVSQPGVAPKLGTGLASLFSEGDLTINPTSLAAGGTALVSVNIVDGNNRVTNRPFGVEISSTCFAQLPPLVEMPVTETIVSQGEARFTYIADGCEGDDTITVKLYRVIDGEIVKSSVLAEATGTITVSPAQIGAILFNSIESQNLGFRGIGNPKLPAQTSIEFKVVDNNGNPVSGETVDFELSNTTGGVSLATNTSVTNDEGIAKAIVSSGTTHVITSVIAKVTKADGTVLQTSSLPISVTSGYPVQNGFSISLNTFNPGAYNVDNVEVNVSVIARDYFGNPVPDGTLVNFQAESGVLDKCSLINSACISTWRSGGNRPDVVGSNSLGRVNERVGMTTILAYTLGEGDFTDQNGNFTYDVGEPFESFAEVFRDDNWNGTLDLDVNGRPVEDFIDFDVDGEYSLAPTVFQGAACSQAARDAGHCASLMHVRAQTRLMQSVANSVEISFYSLAGSTYTAINPPTLAASGEFYVVLQDANGNVPASGTTLSVSGSGYDIFADDGEVTNGIGILEDAGLPPYGALYRVSYLAEADPKNIDVTATSGDKTVKVRLTP